jgi:hypothetical protein
MPKTSNNSSKNKQKQIKPFKPFRGKMLILWAVVFAAIAGAVIYRSFALDAGFTLSPYASRRVPLSGLVYVHAWWWECNSSLYKNMTYSVHGYLGNGQLIFSSTNYSNGNSHSSNPSGTNYIYANTYLVMKSNGPYSMACEAHTY